MICFTEHKGTEDALTEKNLSYSVLLDCYGALLTERQRDLLGLYYDDDLSLSEISEDTGLSRQGVRDAIKRGEAELDRLENALGIASSYSARRIEIDLICGELDEIADGEITGAEAVRERLRRISDRIRSLSDR